MDDDALMRRCQSRVGEYLLDTWRLEVLIGVGGMAAVYCASHHDGRRGAAKILHPQYAREIEIQGRFRREATIARTIEHPAVVRVLDEGVSEEGEPFFVMELLAGESVDAKVAKSGGRLPTVDAVSIVVRTLSALETAHDRGIVHRDLKPENLFLTTTGDLKVLDFGIARMHDQALPTKTRTGAAMGTPEYMAPEQALGRWAEVDARTDIWSVGAILFSLLSGRLVHEAETRNEILVETATRPAPSLARVLPRAPARLVSIVDRALSYDRVRRYPDAASMRADLEGFARDGGLEEAPERPIHVAVGSLEPTLPMTAAAPVPVPSQRPPAGRGYDARREPDERASERASEPAAPPPREIPAARADAQLAAMQPSPAVEAYGAVRLTPDGVRALRELFTTIERLLAAQSQYGIVHGEYQRRLDAAFAQATTALASAETDLVWNVTPYAFVAGDETLWEPDAPLDRIPYLLFADGVRMLGLSRGLDRDELSQLLRILTLDRAGEVMPEDDFVTMLWDADLEHVVHQAIDAFSEGDQESRARFERQARTIIDGARADATADLEAAFRAQRDAGSAPGPDTGAPFEGRVRAVLDAAGAIDVETAARVGGLALPRRAPAEGPSASLGPADGDALRVLEVRIRDVPDDADARFAFAAACAYREASRRGGAALVVSPLRSAVDSLAPSNARAALSLVASVCVALREQDPTGDGPRLSATLAGELLSLRTLRLVLEGATGPAATETFVDGLKVVLELLDDTHLGEIIRRLGDVRAPAVRTLLLEYVERRGRGHERALGDLCLTADEELGVLLVRLLVRMGTADSREAFSRAIKSPHPLVRIEALSHLQDGSETLKTELRAILEDRDPNVRLAVLVAMQRHGIRAAGPQLVLRMRHAGFEKLPLAERKQAFTTLATLAANRAEQICVEILGESKLLASSDHEETRALAAETLGRIGQSWQALECLEAESEKRLRNSERVRSAARSALDSVRARATRPSKRPGGDSS